MKKVKNYINQFGKISLQVIFIFLIMTSLSYASSCNKSKLARLEQVKGEIELIKIRIINMSMDVMDDFDKKVLEKIYNHEKKETMLVKPIYLSSANLRARYKDIKDLRIILLALIKERDELYSIVGNCK